MTEHKRNDVKETATLIDYLKALPLYLLPQHLLSRMMQMLTRITLRPLKELHINWFIKQFRVNMQEAAEEDPTHYACFNDFFTRALKPGLRPIVDGPQELACPVDGTVSQAARIEHGRLIQAKGHEYSLEALLGDPRLAETFAKGSFATLYLSPRDYHRIHMPCAGTLTEMTHIPGRLFSVNDASAKVIPNLFASNERVVTCFDTEYGRLAMVLVGAIFVGSIETVWHGVVTPPSRHAPCRWHYPLTDRPAPQFLRGEEMGRFNMGSTVIVLVANPDIALDEMIQAGNPVHMGQLLAREQAAE